MKKFQAWKHEHKKYELGISIDQYYGKPRVMVELWKWTFVFLIWFIPWNSN